MREPSFLPPIHKNVSYPPTSHQNDDSSEVVLQFDRRNNRAGRSRIVIREQGDTHEPNISPSNRRKQRRPVAEFDYSSPDDGKIIKTTLTPTSSQGNVDAKDIESGVSKPPV